MKYYVVASNTEFTVICKAKSKKHAMDIAKSEYWDIHGFMPEAVNNDFEVYLLSEYLEAGCFIVYEEPLL